MSSTNDTILENPYLVFEETGPEGRKTAVVQIPSASSGDQLGEIRWFGRWRQYCFYPATETIFNAGCMETIVARINDLMERRKGVERLKAYENEDDWRYDLPPGASDPAYDGWTGA